MTQQEEWAIRDAVQETLDETFGVLDFPDYIDATDELTSEQKEWAKEHLGVSVIAEIL
jgi:hypothetical protein